MHFLACLFFIFIPLSPLKWAWKTYEKQHTINSVLKEIILYCWQL